MYQDLLAGPKGPMGAPPPVKAPMPPPPLGAPPPGPMLGAAPPMASPGAEIPAPAPDEAAALAAHETHLKSFTHQLVQDYVAGKISRDDLKKGVGYTGMEPYGAWKQNNVLHLKEQAKANS